MSADLDELRLDKEKFCSNLLINVCLNRLMSWCFGCDGRSRLFNFNYWLYRDRSLNGFFLGFKKKGRCGKKRFPFEVTSIILKILFSGVHAKALFIKELFNRSKGAQMLTGIECFAISHKGNNIKLFFPGSEYIGLKPYFVRDLIFSKFFL